MGGDAFTNEDVVEDAFLVEQIAILGVAGPQAAAKIVGIDDLTVACIGPLAIRDLLAHEGMKTADADPRPPLVMVVVVIADVKEEVSVVKNPDPGQFVIDFGHEPLHQAETFTESIRSL